MGSVLFLAQTQSWSQYTRIVPDNYVSFIQDLTSFHTQSSQIRRISTNAAITEQSHDNIYIFFLEFGAGNMNQTIELTGGESDGNVQVSTVSLCMDVKSVEIVHWRECEGVRIEGKH